MQRLGDRKGLGVLGEAERLRCPEPVVALGLTHPLPGKHGGLGASILTWLINKHICTAPLTCASHQAKFRGNKEGHMKYLPSSSSQSDGDRESMNTHPNLKIGHTRVQVPSLPFTVSVASGQPCRPHGTLAFSPLGCG